jgi:hypothetical protein
MSVGAGMGVERVANDGEFVGRWPVVDPSTAFFSVDETDLVEGFEVMADGWLGDAECVDEVAGSACFALGGDEAEESESCGVGQDFEPARQFRGVVRGQRFDGERLTAFGDGVHVPVSFSVVCGSE